jgi:DNA-binding MarR family transcriptional regulator
MAATPPRELTLDSFLPYVLNQLADRISAELSTIYIRDHQLSIPEWRVIANIAEHKTLNARRIVTLTAMEKSMVSRAVKTLSERSLISVSASSADSRSKDLELTAKGKTLYKILVPKVLHWEAELLAGFSRTEHQELLRLLSKIDSAIPI